MNSPGAHLDSAFARAATKDPRLAGSVRSAPYERPFSELWATRLLDRPAFLGSSEAATLTADLDAYLRLLGSLPTRLFGGDVVAYGGALRMPTRRAELLARFAERAPTPFGRADLYHDGTHFRLLEFNVASDVGGLEYPAFHRGLMQTSEFAQFAHEHGLKYVDTAAQLVQTWREECMSRGLGQQPTVAILGANGNTTTLSRLLLATADVLERHGLQVAIGEIYGLRYRGDRVTLDGVAVDIVLRFFTIDDLWEDAEALAHVEPLLNAHAEERVVLWTPLDSSLYSNKGAMALLADPRAREAMTPDELIMLDRLLPWTRLLVGSTVEVEGEDIDLLEYCRAERTQLVLKPSRGFGGAGVIAGWEVTDREWQRALRLSHGSDCVVQRRVTPMPFVAADAGGGPAVEWAATWGVFLTPGGFGGAMVRALPADGPTVLYFGNRAARSTGVFVFPDQTEQV